MIKKAGPEYSEEVFGLLAKVYQEHSMLRLGIQVYRELLSRENYHSFVHVEGDKVIGHGGLFIKDGLVILNALIVDSEYQNKGIANFKSTNYDTYYFRFSKSKNYYSRIYFIYDGGRLYSKSFRTF